MSEPILLRVDGAVTRPLELTYGDLKALPEPDQVLDVSRFHPGRRGDGVTLESLLRLAEPRPEANYLTLHASRDDFHVSIPLPAVRGEGIVIFRLGESPLGPEHGGPVRFIIRDPAACHTDELDDCANVKYLDRIELTIRRGRDTRPADEAAHAALHAKQGG
ncbi:MAG: molybdopterin-dependent oxidoreductase [Isosphaeraceae bacterium]|nr:molybdopterin-dependent oxidoreductase [Isosphaeraceae bacterium]